MAVTPQEMAEVAIELTDARLSALAERMADDSRDDKMFARDVRALSDLLELRLKLERLGGRDTH
ncbi:MAG: hypothetical protein U9R79_09670 [Armatimonadota bacterium]|nr:hypothetical protein [Armatimonadota bacterium]